MVYINFVISDTMNCTGSGMGQRCHPPLSIGVHLMKTFKLWPICLSALCVRAFFTNETVCVVWCGVVECGVINFIYIIYQIFITFGWKRLLALSFGSWFDVFSQAETIVFIKTYWLLCKLTLANNLQQRRSSIVIVDFFVESDLFVIRLIRWCEV